MRIRELIALLSVVAACDAPTGLSFPAGLERLAPPPVYREWWAWTERCAGRTGDFDAVAWYVVPGAAQLPGPGGFQGAWYSKGNRIVLAEDALYWGRLVRHEMLHSLVRGTGHPREQFVGRCGGIVACEGACLTEAGPAPAPPANTAHVAPGALIVGVEAWPAPASTGAPVESFALVVTARNPRDAPVIVDLYSAPETGPAVTFEHRVEGPGFMIQSNVRARADEVIWFAPGETKRFLFDYFMDGLGFRIDSPTATLTLRGAYGSAWAPSSVSVTIRIP